MALVVYDRVQETTATTGTGSITLSGAVSGYQSFAVVGNGNTTFYCIVNGSAWEVGIGTYSTTGPTLARTTVLSNSDATTSPITLVGASSVFCTYPSEKSVNLDASGNVSPLGTITSAVWNGTTIPVAYGGTGVTTSSGADSVVLRDTNVNVSANNFLPGFTPITASGGTTVLTVASTYFQRITGTTTETIQLPDATTLALGTTFIIDNDTNSDVTITNGATTVIDTDASGSVTFVYLMNNSTVAGSWGRYHFIPNNYDFSTTTANFGAATLTNGTWNGVAIDPAYGGTGLTTFTAANNALYSTGATTLTAGTLPVLAGGTGSTTASGARSSLGAAASGANSDITSLSGLTTPLSVGQGGTGLSSVTANRIPYGNGTSALNTNVNFTYDGTTLLVGDSGGLAGATNPVISSVGNANNYVQSYIYNIGNGSNTSADFTAYPSNGSDASGWVDVGITGLNFNQAAFSVTGPNESYLFGSSPSTASTSVTGNLVYATDSYGSTNYHQWYVGGFNQAKNAWKMQLTSTGLQLANALGTAYGGTGNTTGQAASVANALTISSPLTGTSYNGSSAVSIGIPQATGSVSGYLSSTDWTTFNNKGSGTVTSVTGTAPIVSSGGTTPAISITQASTSTNGYLSSTDWNTFNGKQAALVSGTNIKTVGGTSLLGSGDVGTIGVSYGGTGATTLTANNVLLGNGTSALQTVAPGTSGNVLTSNGTTWTSAAAGGGFPAGTLMLFQQTAAPTGWTKQTTHDNKALRVVSGTAGSGGTTAFTSVFTNQTPTFSGSNGTLGISATTLSTAQMPSHNHTFPIYIFDGTTTANLSVPSGNTGNWLIGNLGTSSVGSGSSHTHSLSGTISGSVGAVTLNVQYVDLIIASKN